MLPIQDKRKDCTKSMAEELCKVLYEKLEPAGYYPALTGGLLYKDGNRKDIDVIIYRNRQKVKSFEAVDLTGVLSEVGVTITGSFGFVTKAEWKGIVVDIFNPETNDEVFNEWYENQKKESAEIKNDFINY